MSANKTATGLCGTGLSSPSAVFPVHIIDSASRQNWNRIAARAGCDIVAEMWCSSSWVSALVNALWTTCVERPPGEEPFPFSPRPKVRGKPCVGIEAFDEVCAVLPGRLWAADRDRDVDRCLGGVCPERWEGDGSGSGCRSEQS